MPVPIIWKDKCFIDFKCELQLKSRLQLDLYTEGLNRTPQLILKEKDPWGVIIKNGVLVVDKNNYIDIEKEIKKKFQDIEFSSNFVKGMYLKLDELSKTNQFFEAKIFENDMNYFDFKDYMEKLLNVMALLSIQWLSFDMNIIKKISNLEGEEISIMASPLLYEPYHIRYQKSFLNILENPEESSLKKFILEYAFLENFEIDKNEYENIELLEKRVKEEQEKIDEYRDNLNHYEQMKRKNKIIRQKIIEKILSQCSEEEYQKVYNNLVLLRACTDEECRLGL